MPGAAVACLVVWVAGSGSWLLALRVLESRLTCRPFLLLRGLLLARHPFIAGSCGDDMTKPIFFEDLPRVAGCCEPGSVRSSCVCPAKGGVHNVHTFVHGRLFDPHFDPFPRVLRHRFMQFSVAGDMSSRPGSSVSLAVPVSGNVFGLLGPIRRQSPGVWDPDSSSGGAPGDELFTWEPGTATRWCSGPSSGGCSPGGRNIRHQVMSSAIRHRCVLCPTKRYGWRSLGSRCGVVDQSEWWLICST